MPPIRPDIAAPELPPGVPWLGAKSPRMARLAAAGPVLVHFFDFAQLNSVRALPYVRGWHRRYGEAGLSVLGVHSPRFGCTAGGEALERGIQRLEIAHPVADDSAYAIWRDYGAHGWPSLFLWGRGGALRLHHLGEGAYRETEMAIQEALRDAGLLDGGMPDPLEPLRPTDAPGALVVPPSEEVFPGGSRLEPLRADRDGEPLMLAYAAGGAHATLDGQGHAEIELDGGERRRLAVGGPGLYELAAHPHHERHELLVRPSSGGARVVDQLCAGHADLVRASVAL